MRTRVLAWLMCWTLAAPAWAATREQVQDTLAAALTQIRTQYVDAVDPAGLVAGGLRGLAPLAEAAGPARRDALERSIAAEARAASEQARVRLLAGEVLRFADGPAREAALGAALAGMVAGLDSYSRRITPDELKPPRASIGVELRHDQGRLVVVRPLPGGPAAGAGLRSGDEIVRVDGRPVAGLPLPEAVSLLRGEAGTPTTLTLRGPDGVSARERRIVRAPVPPPPALTWSLDGQVAILAISAFNGKTLEDTRAALDAATAQARTPVEGIVLDLRGNAGGLLDVAEQLAGMWLPANSLLASLRGRTAPNARRLVARQGDAMAGVPMAVLVDARTGAGAELLAAALQDHGRALLIGQATAGAGTVQTVLPLPQGQGALLLTSARIHRATGAPLDGVGVTPDLLLDEAARKLTIRADLVADFNVTLKQRIEAMVAAGKPGDDTARRAAVAALTNAHVRTRNP